MLLLKGQFHVMEAMVYGDMLTAIITMVTILSLGVKEHYAVMLTGQQEDFTQLNTPYA